jgi:predicted DNA-binding transcriptional regulator YafY
MDEKKPLVFRYKNWEGNIATRKVIPLEVWYGKTEWHKEEQWLLKALDLDKNAQRDFAMRDILSVE